MLELHICYTLLPGKGLYLIWSADCETAFDSLVTKLLTSPVLAYPEDFTLETNASCCSTKMINNCIQ